MFPTGKPIFVFSLAIVSSCRFDAVLLSDSCENIVSSFPFEGQHPSVFGEDAAVVDYVLASVDFGEC